MTRINDHRWVLWSLSRHHAPWTASWTSEAAEGLVSCLSKPPSWSVKMTMKKQYMVYNDYNDECMYDLKKKRKDKPVLALRWICYHLISSMVATFINYLKPGKACFIQLFVFTCYRCGSQVLLAYKRLKWRQKREM